MVESGISVAVDVERLGECIAEQVAHRLAGLFPSEATDFWVTLVEQADDNDDGDPPPTPLDPDPGDEPAGPLGRG